MLYEIGDADPPPLPKDPSNETSWSTFYKLVAIGVGIGIGVYCAYTAVGYFWQWRNRNPGEEKNDED